MPTVNLNVESQIASEITRATLITTVGTSSLKRKHYHITDAVNNTKKIAVFYRTDSAVTFWGYDVNNGQTGKYFLIQDLFIPIVEAQGAVLSYVNLAAFPAIGATNTVYIAQDTGTGYTWNGSAYVALSGGTVFAVNFAALPVTGTTNTLYITTDNGNSYLWDGAAYVQTSSGTPVNFVPLAGTVLGSPITGDFQASRPQFLIYQGTLGSISNGVDSRATFLGNSISLFRNAGSGNLTTIGIDSSGNGSVASSHSGFQGLKYSADYSGNFTLESQISQRVLKSRFWTKAGTPTTTDDSTQGFVVGSLIYDTTNNILYRCTSNTASAATWTVEYNAANNQTIALTGANVTTTSATAVDITGLVTPTLPANSTWYFEVFLATACTGTGGIKFGFTAPSGYGGLLYVEGVSTSLTGYQQSLTSGALSATGVTRFNSGAFVKLSGRVVIDTTPGAVQLQFASGTGGQTSTIGGVGASIIKITRVS